jgi:uncharacterized damage-inducible protein DinB
LEEVLLAPSHQLVTWKGDEKWSAQEHAGHLVDLEPLWLTRVEDYVAGSDQLTPTDLNNRDRRSKSQRAPQAENSGGLPRSQRTTT